MEQSPPSPAPQGGKSEENLRESTCLQSCPAQGFPACFSIPHQDDPLSGQEATRPLGSQFSDSYPGLMGLPQLLRPPKPSRGTLSLPTRHVVVAGGGEMGWQPPGCPPLRLSWALLPMGAHTHACPQKSARNPKQHSWVGRREGPAVSGTPNSFLPGACLQSHGTLEGAARGFKSSP